MLNSGKAGPMVFEPDYVKLEVGDSVVFKPADLSHNSASSLVPTGAKPWVGVADKPLTVKFDKEGVYIYKCDPHLVMAMVGVIQVGRPVNKDAAIAEEAKLAASFVMNKDRLKKALASVK
ncbi:MAG: pseudoazurin [Bdellovibrionaceae bacterium]|nr:pseudoazurin [Pseudobdellovibrionaceae bacterium]